MSKLRLMYSSNAFWSSSGYGVQGRSLLPRLAELPEFDGRQNIAQFAWYGLQGGCHTVEGFKIYPAGADAYGNDIIDAHCRDFGANVLVSLIDVWVMRDTAKKVAPTLWCPWLPIDHDPVPQAVLDSLQGAYMPLTYSKWGHDLLKAAGVENTYIPHGIEPDIYKVLPDVENVRRFKQQALRCNGHLTVMVAANKGYPDRKAYQVQLRAWADFAKDKPDARLYCHTEPTTMYGGLDLVKLAQSVGIENKIMFPDRYGYYNGFPPEFLAMVYNAADAFMGNSMSEGFGIPIIEAQACGTPVVVTDFSSMPELVRWGYKIAPLDMIWTPMNAWQAWPDKNGIRDALEALYTQWHEQGDTWTLPQRHHASTAIRSEFSWDTIVREHWAPFFAGLVDVAPPLDARFAPQPVNQTQKVGERTVVKRQPKMAAVTPGAA